MRKLNLVALTAVCLCLLASTLALGQAENPPASTKESRKTSGKGMTAAEQTGTGVATYAQHKAINPPDAPKAIGPYSSAIQAGNMLFLAGQLAIDPATQQFKADASIEDQTRQTLDNLKAVLAASGMTMANVVSVSVFMKDLNDFSKMNAVYATYFKEVPPARATVEVARLARDAKIEISMIAMK